MRVAHTPSSFPLLTILFSLACADPVGVERAHAVGAVASEISLSSSYATRRDTVRLLVGQTRNLSVHAARSRRAQWLSSNPSVATVTAEGLLRALAAGNTTVRFSAFGIAEETPILVSEAAQSTALWRISMSPDTITMLPNGSTVFTATGRTKGGGEVPVSVRYSSSQGEIGETNGVYIAPRATGVYRVFASQIGGTLRDTSYVIVQAPASVPSSRPSTFTPNLPQDAGLQLVVDTRFENWVLGVPNAGSLTFVRDGRLGSDQTAPFGANYFETFYPGNHLGNGGGGATITGPGKRQWTRVYFALMMWLSPEYSIHSNAEKFFYPRLADENGVFSVAAMHLGPVGGLGTNGPALGFWTLLRPQHYMTQQNGLALIWKGQWTLVEMYLQMNTPGSANGVWRAWVNGSLAANVANMQYSDLPRPVFFDGIVFDGTRGGGASSSPTPPNGQVRRYNRLAFYAAP